MIKSIAFFLLLLVGCSGSVESNPPPPSSWEPYPGCACGWVDDAETLTQSCAAPFRESSTETLETQDDGENICQVYRDSCADASRPDCAKTCERTHVTCQPIDPHGLP